MKKASTNRMLWVPWDNDGWVRYESLPLTKSMTSHGVTAVFEGESRKGLVCGSVEHDTWKTGVYVNASDNVNIDEFALVSGYVSSYTRDVLPHGKVKGKEVGSAKFMFGLFDDWRKGMDTFGQANNCVVPRAVWKGGNPFGWSSWGSMQDKISFSGVCDVSDFYRDELVPLGFHDVNGNNVMSLDAFTGDNISTFNIKQLRIRCDNANQTAGIYYGPFCDWNGDPERIVEGSDNQYRYKDIWLKVNGQEHRQGGICLDPTHPGTKMAIKYHMDEYKRWGYRYMKVDFLTNGAIEGDSYYNPEVTTGVQAYNEGMQYMLDEAPDDMYIVLAISPLFPYQYAHGRRTCCDSYSLIGETEYVMNSTSYGWWTNQLYAVNDPDHLVMFRDDQKGNESIGVNRARLTSGVVTGAYIIGDNFSDRVAKGYPELARERAKLLLSNKDINEIPRTCGSFMPVEGYKARNTNGAENLLRYETDKYVYMACINYNTAILAVNGNISFERLGVDPENVASIKELWYGTDIAVKNGLGFDYAVSPSDAKIYRITKKSGMTGIPDDSLENNTFVKIYQQSDQIIIHSGKAMKAIRIYNLQGICQFEENVSGTDCHLSVTDYIPGVYILQIITEDNTSEKIKIVLT